MATPPRFDVVVAVVLTLVTQAELLLVDDVQGPFALQVASFALITAPLAWRRSATLAATAAIAAGFAAQVILAGDAPVLGGLVSGILITYAAGAYLGGRAAVAGAAILVLGIIVAALWDEGKRGLVGALSNLLIFAVIFAGGRWDRRWDSTRQHRADTLELTVREQEEHARAATVEERARIARELHDVIAHNVSLMVLQAGAARQVLEREPGRVREPLLSIEESGRQAIAEMRRLLGILRENGGPLSLSPQPSLAQLGELAESAERSGLKVDLRVQGEPDRLPPGLGLTAYRIVQEALTNAVKHARAAHVTVEVHHRDRELELDVTDDGRATAADGPGNGHGLIGMRERVAVYGGLLDAGSRPEGGFRVHARLPIDAEDR
jgi:signal transduction histidine kinase